MSDCRYSFPLNFLVNGKITSGFDRGMHLYFMDVSPVQEAHTCFPVVQLVPVFPLTGRLLLLSVQQTWSDTIYTRKKPIFPALPVFQRVHKDMSIP
jgi:hypothetical protein